MCSSVGCGLCVVVWCVCGVCCSQSWGSYFMKVIYYILLLYQYNILQLLLLRIT